MCVCVSECVGACVCVSVCVCVCVRARARARMHVRACMCVCVFHNEDKCQTNGKHDKRYRRYFK